MSKLKNDFDHANNKVAGKVKEVAGKVTGNAQLELEGKMQSAKADLKKNVNIADKIDAVKESIADGINKTMDKNKKN